jgi:hypothetical protein
VRALARGAGADGVILYTRPRISWPPPEQPPTALGSTSSMTYSRSLNPRGKPVAGSTARHAYSSGIPLWWASLLMRLRRRRGSPRHEPEQIIMHTAGNRRQRGHRRRRRGQSRRDELANRPHPRRYSSVHQQSLTPQPRRKRAQLHSFPLRKRTLREPALLVGSDQRRPLLSQNYAPSTRITFLAGIHHLRSSASSSTPSISVSLRVDCGAPHGRLHTWWPHRLSSDNKPFRTCPNPGNAASHFRGGFALRKIR